jgi:secreted trypsin-like serine protease
VYPHQQYNATTHDNDIALLNVSGSISSTIPRVTLAAPPAPGVEVLVAGWGVTSESGKQSLLLQEVKVPMVTGAQCKAKYDGLTDNMICAGEAGKDSCQGDSGGPLFLDAGNGIQQVGIVSYGVGCGRDGWPGVYSKVDHYRSWIATTMSQ